MSSSIIDAANGRWPDILSTIAGLTPEQLTDTHQPCPLCGGTDRYRFDDLDGSGSWFCNQCGGKDGRGGAGNGMDLLMRRTGLPFADAARRIEQHLGLQPEPTSKRRTKPHRIPETPPPDAPPPAMGRAVAQWCYRDAAGNQLFWIQRLNLPAQNGKPARKVFIHRVWLDGGWHYPRSRGENADPFTCEWPAPRPLYNLNLLAQRPDAKVLLVEGEKAADAAASLFPHAVVTSWPNGSKAIDVIDWTPLSNRDVILWPDNDMPGRQAMAALAKRLMPLASSIRIIAPPSDAPDGWDLADATWTPQEAAEYVRANIHTVEIPATPEPEPQTQLVELTQSPNPSPPKTRRIQPGDISAMPFRCLGFDRNVYFYLPAEACQVVPLTPAQHNRNYLITLAPLNDWASAFDSVTEQGKHLTDWALAADTIITACIKAGVYDPARVRGRGTWFDAGRVILHLGGRLIINGQSCSITSLPSTFTSNYFYENAKPIEGPGSDTLTDDLARDITALARTFRWETKVSAYLLLGWVVLAPVCGALDWRPHIWITGPAGCGKTSLLKLFMKPLLGGMFEGATGGTTEAGLRGQLRSDAIPIVFDELEQNEQKDRQQVQNILALARIASSEGGKIYKGTSTGGVNTFEIRSMFCVSSINVGLVQRADLDRFCVLSLRKDEVSKDDWNDFEEKLLKICSDDNGRKLIARTINQIPLIRKNSKTLATALASKYGQRFGDQYGTLLAGAWTLNANGGGEITLPEARAWIDSMDWETREVDANDADEVRCINKILQTILPLDGGRRLSIVELVQLAAAGRTYLTDHNPTPGDEIETILGRYGLKVANGCLAVANSSTNLQTLLKDTPWAGTAYRQALRRLPDAIAANSVIRFKGMGPSRATLIPLAGLAVL